VSTSTPNAEIGIITDAGPGLGYGHAVRCLRLARALATRNRVAVYALSQACRQFVERIGGEFTLAAWPHKKGTALPPAVSGTVRFPPLVITDLRQPHGITALIHRSGSRHISIHDLGLAQCHSDVAIDGSIIRLFPFSAGNDRALFLGPQYMITRPPVQRQDIADTVLVTLGGGSTAGYARTICERLWDYGLKTIVTRGFARSLPRDERYCEIHTDSEIADAMSRCCFAISGSGTTLYDLLASGIPTIAVAFDRFQLRTADAFHELGAALSAGLAEHVSPAAWVRNINSMLEDRPFVQRIARAGQMLVDGKGLSRVTDIVRRQLWLTSRVKTYIGC
jgi:UDP-2,4-diacetamido-2,4,6-trideoxy-beta-L-altropyranose hydrolase